MTFTKVSVLVPTRHRLPRLARLLDSYRATVHVHHASELVFRVDTDDQPTQAFLGATDWTRVIGDRGQGYRDIPRYFEELRHVATGDVFLLGNDDMVFRTPDWATRVLDAANRYPDGLFVFGVDTRNAQNFVFPIVSRAAVDQMGRLLDPRIYWGDIYLRDVMAAFGRALPLADVRIDHEWMGETPDQTFLDAGQAEARNWDSAYQALHRRCVDEAVARLQGAGVAC